MDQPVWFWGSFLASGLRPELGLQRLNSCFFISGKAPACVEILNIYEADSNTLIVYIFWLNPSVSLRINRRDIAIFTYGLYPGTVVIASSCISLDILHHEFVVEAVFTLKLLYEILDFNRPVLLVSILKRLYTKNQLVLNFVLVNHLDDVNFVKVRNLAPLFGRPDCSFQIRLQCELVNTGVC